jgi:hypothetical protein
VRANTRVPQPWVRSWRDRAANRTENVREKKRRRRGRRMVAEQGGEERVREE